ncbi:MAG: ribosomal protein S18-alanine N-acetyltransferase [Clostridium sp.]|nr:ribosomal protein S18-alanine N-acetyltransferase [Clostridium sp.]
MNIRLMVEEDIDSVEQIETQLFSKPWTKQDFINSLSDMHNIYVVAENEQQEIIGYSGIWGVLDEGQITNVAVRTQDQGKGIGYEMLCELIEIGKNEGLQQFTLEVRKSNEKAIHLYEKLGFIDEGIRKNFYDKPVEDAIIMWLREQHDEQED